MAAQRLPTPGSDEGSWGDILNDYLAVEHDSSGTLKARTDGTLAHLSSGKVPTTELGSGSASISNFLRGDGSWAIPAGGVTIDSTSSHIAPLGVQAAGSSGLAADATHVHAMPRLDQAGAPTSSVALNSQRITGLAKGTAVTDALTLGQAAKIFWVDAYGADPTGTTDSTAAFTAAYAAMGGASAAGLLGLGTGAYKVGTSASLPTFGRNQGIVGPGSGSTTLYYYGNSSCITALDSSFSSSLSRGGTFSGFTIDGTNAGSSAIGLSWGNLNSGRIHDVSAQDFSNIGMQFKNTGGAWSEQLSVIDCRLNTNGIGAVFDNGSFDYSIYEFVITTLENRTGILLQNGAQLVGCRLQLRGNFQAASTNSGVVLAIEPNGGNSVGTACILRSEVYVSVECNGTGVGPMSIKMAGASGCALQATGQLYFASAPIAFQNASVGFNSNLGFSGTVSEPLLGAYQYGDALTVQGGSQWSAVGTFPTIYAAAGDVSYGTLASGSNAVTFQGVGSRPRRIECFIAQPSSGSAGTVSWPANVKWPGGSAPTLSAANGAIDRVRLTYLPITGNWYGELSGANYH